MKNKLFIIIIPVLIISIILIVMLSQKSNKKEIEILSAKIESTLFKEYLVGDYEIKNLDKAKIFKDNFDLEIPVYCKELTHINVDKKKFIKLLITTNNGIEIYHIDSEKQVIQKENQPNMSNHFSDKYNKIFYQCEKDIINNYKEKIKDLI